MHVVGVPNPLFGRRAGQPPEMRPRFDPFAPDQNFFPGPSVGWEMDRGEDPGYSIDLGVETLGSVEGQECSKCLLNVLCKQWFPENILLIQPSPASIVLFLNIYFYDQTPVPKPCPQSCPWAGRYTYFYCTMPNIICDLSYWGPFQTTAKLCHLLWQAQAKDAGGLILIRILTWKLMKGNMIFGWEK